MRAVFTYLFILITAFSATAQKESDKLKAKQRDLQKKIQYTKQLIGDTKNKERLTMTELSIINQQIAYRNELISVFSHQLSRIEAKIQENQDIIESLERDIKDLKEKYAKMIYFAYKHRNAQVSPVMLWISGEDINKAYLRMKYMKQLAEYRKLQVEFIRRTQEDLRERQEALQRDIIEKQEVLLSKDEEKRAYEQDKESQRQVLAKLKQEESKLKRQLDDQEEAKRRLNIAIKKAIEKEIAQQAKQSESGSFGLTPEAKLEGKSFSANKGRLPWPVQQGEVTGKFGKQAHPVLPGVFTQNNGVDISTQKGATMRAVFSGKVSSIFVIPGAGKAVMLSHGNFRTVYANLQEVYVKKGDAVEAKQEVGVLLPSQDGKISEAHFEIWSISNGDMQKLNPAYWLSR